MSRTTAQVDARLTTEIQTRADQLAGTRGSALLTRIVALEKRPTADLTALQNDIEFLMGIVCPPKKR